MIKLIESSAEHHFLTTLEDLKKRPDGWFGLSFSLSKMLNHSDLCSQLDNIPSKLQAMQRKRDGFVDKVQKALGDAFTGNIYAFTDYDVLVLACAQNKEEQAKLTKVFKELSGVLGEGFSDMQKLASVFRHYQKVADSKILSARRMTAYDSMADEYKVNSIAARRERRDEPLVMVVEDDRFTLHYA